MEPTVALQWYRMVLNVIVLMHLGIRTGCRISIHLKPFCYIASLRVSMTSRQIWLMWHQRLRRLILTIRVCWKECFDAISRSGEQLYKDRVVQRDPDTGERFLNLCSRGWVQGDADMTLEQMIRTMHALFDSVRPCHVHSWSEGDCLVFNNYKYLHRRHNPNNISDPNRRLIRMWFTSDLS